MKKIFLVITILFLSTSCQQDKFAYVDNSKLINESDERKALDKNYELKDEQFKKKTDSISQAYQLEFQKTSATAKSSSRSKADELMGALEQKRQFLGQQIQLEQQQLGKAYQTEIDSLILRLKDFVKDYGKKNGYTYIFGTSDASAAVMYGKEENDLTETILDALNEKYKAKK